jgi:hypothetical protein
MFHDDFGHAVASIEPFLSLKIQDIRTVAGN